MELKCIKKRAHLKLKSKLRDKICTLEDKRCTYQAKCELASSNAQCRPYNGRDEQHQYIDRNCDRDCAYNNKL
jgi:hypothetical protein